MLSLDMGSSDSTLSKKKSFQRFSYQHQTRTNFKSKLDIKTLDSAGVITKAARSPQLF